MDLKSLFYRSGNSPAAAPTVEPESEESAAPPVRLASGPLGSRAAKAPTPFARRSAVAKINEQKLADLRKRVFAVGETAYTLVVEQAQRLQEAGIADLTQQFKGAIATTRVGKADVLDGLAKHKTALVAQMDGFNNLVAEVRMKAQRRRTEIAEEIAAMQKRFQELEQEDAALQQQEQDLGASEQEFAQVASALEAEITQTGDQIVSLFPATEPQ